MATTVLDLELESAPRLLTGLERYERALALVRFRGHPLGQTFINVTDGRILENDLREALIKAAGPNLLETWVRDFLEFDRVQASKFKTPSATVAICTRDRPDDVGRCLDALMRLDLTANEIAVIDNCPSTESTREVVKCYPSVRYIHEARPGLNIARNRALRESQNEIVAFIDDDAAPDRGWLRSLVQNFADPLVLCVTGLTMPSELETDAQEWHERYSSFNRGFRRRVFDSAWCNPTAVGQVGSGVNMALRRKVTDLVGVFDEALDSGTPARSGGDAEMFSRILSCGYRIIYEPRALNWHRHRRTWPELRQAIYGYGVGVYAAWTRTLLVERQLSMIRPAASWLLTKQIPTFVRSVLRQPSAKTVDLVLAELRGCAAGPWAYLAARRRLQKFEQ